MKKEAGVYAVFILLTVIVAAVLLIAKNYVSDEDLFEQALTDSDAELCAKIDPKLEINYEERTGTKIKVQGFAVLRDMCFSELAEPSDDKLAYCEEVSNTNITFCEPNADCIEMSAKEACYREVFKDYVSYSMPPQEGEINDKEVCYELSMFRDNCKFLYAVTTGDVTICDTFDNRCPLRKELCETEAAKVNAQSILEDDSVVYKALE